MNKIVVVIVCAVFLTVGRVWAQEAKPLANSAAGGVQSNEAAAVADPSDNAEDETIANDEGYGMDDEEYYGGEEDTVTVPMNAEQENAEAPTPSNAVQALPSNAETK